jgi:hypothetical protein
LTLLSSIIALGALIVGVYGSGAFDQYGGKKQIIATMVIHALPAISVTIPVLLLRVYGLWFGIFLIAQYLLSPPLLGDARHYMTLRPNMNRTVDVVGNAIPGIQGIQRITTDAMGFRVRPPVDYEHKRGFRIFAIGASTTEQIALDDRSTWTYLLQEKLVAETGRPVEVINTGLAGTRALHHLVMLRHILDYSPDCAMFLIGVNDWNKHIREHFGSGYYRREEDEGRLFTRTLLGRALLAGVTRWRARARRGWNLFQLAERFARARGRAHARVGRRRARLSRAAGGDRRHLPRHRRALRLPHPALRLFARDRSPLPPLFLDDAAQRELHSGSRLHGRDRRPLQPTPDPVCAGAGARRDSRALQFAETSPCA